MKTYVCLKLLLILINQYNATIVKRRLTEPKARTRVFRTIILLCVCGTGMGGCFTSCANPPKTESSKDSPLGLGPGNMDILTKRGCVEYVVQAAKSV
jgi:hypothetical protein